MIPIQQTAKGVTFAVKVHPRARKNAITGIVGDALKLALTAPPVEGKANEALRDYLAELLKVRRSGVHIVLGDKHRRKVVTVAGIGGREVLARLTQRHQQEYLLLTNLVSHFGKPDKDRPREPEEPAVAPARRSGSVPEGGVL